MIFHNLTLFTICFPFCVYLECFSENKARLFKQWKEYIHLIIWLAPWSKSRAVTGYSSEQDEALLPDRVCPFCSRYTISFKSKRVHESFIPQNIFRENINDFNWILCQDRTRKPEASTRMNTKKHWKMLTSFKNTFWNKNQLSLSP